jgi:hypothetical protein
MMLYLPLDRSLQNLAEILRGAGNAVAVGTFRVNAEKSPVPPAEKILPHPPAAQTIPRSHLPTPPFTLPTCILITTPLRSPAPRPTAGERWKGGSRSAAPSTSTTVNSATRATSRTSTTICCMVKQPTF